MFHTKIFALIFFVFSVSTAFAQKNSDWKISDYLENLPKEYKVFTGDFIAINPTAETTLIDDKNGYAAYFDQPFKNENAFPIFEMAVFKKKNGEEILVVSNMISDPVCNEYKTFFLQRAGANWLDVKTKVLPKLTPQMFFDSAKTANEFLKAQKKIGNSTGLNLRFSPPRQGTAMNVKLEICDYVPDDFSGEIDFQKFIDKSKTLALRWNKENGIFK